MSLDCRALAVASTDTRKWLIPTNQNTVRADPSSQEISLRSLCAPRDQDTWGVTTCTTSVSTRPAKRLTKPKTGTLRKWLLRLSLMAGASKAPGW